MPSQKKIENVGLLLSTSRAADAMGGRASVATSSMGATTGNGELKADLA
jgi:hypothetical protein